MGTVQRYRGFPFALPALALMAGLIAYPLVYTGWLSVTSERGGFVGAANFAAMADHVNAIAIDPIGALPNLVVPVILLLIVIGILRLFAGAQTAKSIPAISPRPPILNNSPAK